MEQTYIFLHLLDSESIQKSLVSFNEHTELGMTENVQTSQNKHQKKQNPDKQAHTIKIDTPKLFYTQKKCHTIEREKKKDLSFPCNT